MSLVLPVVLYLKVVQVLHSISIIFSIFVVVYGRKTRLISLNHGWKVCFYSILLYELYSYSSIFVLVTLDFGVFKLSLIQMKC